jgi:malonyl-CoA/methylmalonyl-CoA synthetase
LGTLSHDGYLTIIDCSKDMIISGGLNVYPKEIELEIDQIEGVKESAVFGLVDKDWGEVVVAVVVTEGGTNKSPVELSAERIITILQRYLANYKILKHIYFVDQLPRNTMGKLQKNILRDSFILNEMH